MIDIALGLFSDGRDADLAVFARERNASYMAQWRDMELFDEDVEGWGQAFEQVVTRTLARGGRIHFNLTGMNIGEALRGDPDVWVGRYTAWELQQIVRNRDWIASTVFYCDGVVLTAKEAAALGIESVS
jgi:hypothetical protein